MGKCWKCSAAQAAKEAKVNDSSKELFIRTRKRENVSLR